MIDPLLDFGFHSRDLCEVTIDVLDLQTISSTIDLTLRMMLYANNAQFVVEKRMAALRRVNFIVYA
jgi:hypothetical protein